MPARPLLLVIAVVLLVIAAIGAFHVLGGINVGALVIAAAACWVAAQIP